MRILGIDPGFAITGFGVLEYIGNKFSIVDVGAITTEAGLELSDRLLTLSNGLDELITKYKPEVMAVEELFFNTNVKTAIKVGHGRGVALLAAAKADIKVYEYTPLQVKQAVVGYGRAKKEQVQQMVKVVNLKLMMVKVILWVDTLKKMKSLVINLRLFRNLKMNNS